jgi:hypothetical protein
MAAGRALAPLLADEDVTRVAAAIEAAGGACQLPELFVFARDVGRTLPRAAKAAEMPLPTQELERELEASDVAVSADPKNPELAQRFGRASLELGKRYADAGGGNPGLLLEDARTWLARAATERPNDVKLAFDRAKAAYYLSRFEEQEKIALAAFGSFPPRDGLSTEALALVDPKTLGDGDVRRAATLLHAEDKLEALRWIGDAAARLAPTRAGGDPAAEVAGYLWGARSLALVAASPGASETDCISLASYLSLIGLAREATAAWELGANRWPESNDLRAGLNRALWAGGRLDLAPAKAAWIQGAHPDSGACAWHTAYAWMLVAEQERREQRNEAAIDAYERAGRLFAQSITLRPDFETGATHYIAMAHLGTGFAQLARGQRGNALESLAAALERSASVLDVRDGLDREVPDLIDALLEWRDGRKSPLASGTVADALAAATPNSARTVAMVADAELREALRADGRSTVGVTLPSGEVERIPTAEGDEYMLGSIAAARRALAIEDNEATRHLLAQSLVVHAERWLERENTEHSAPLLAEGAGLLGVEPPAPAATLGALRESAEQMRALLGPGRPLFRPGR